MGETLSTERTGVERPEGQAGDGFLRGLRVTLLVVIVAAACYLAYGFGRLWAEWRQALQPAAAARSEGSAHLNAMTAVLPLAGRWSFGELDWNFRSTIVDAKDVAARLSALAATSGGEAAGELPDVSPELLEFARSLEINPVKRDGNQIYGLDRPELKAQLVVRTIAGHAKAVSLAAAYPQSADHWQLLEFTPGSTAGHSDSTADHLLPLPKGAQRKGGRFADDGQLLLELVTLDSNADELIAAWKQSGWEVRPSGLGDPDSFSCLCARGDEVIYAWSANNRNSLKNLMLVRTPNSADTGP